LVTGKTIGIDATTLEAHAALRSIVRRDSGESYEEFLTTLAKASGIGTPTRADTSTADDRAIRLSSSTAQPFQKACSNRSCSVIGEGPSPVPSPTDEIGELPLMMQVKIRRALQNREVQRQRDREATRHVDCAAPRSWPVSSPDHR
jgi:hypothetical protein